MINKCLYFNGKDSKGIIKHNNFYNVFPFSIQCWIKTAQNNSNHCSIINKYVSGSSNGWSLNIINGKISFWIYNTNTSKCDFEGRTLINDDKWHNITVSVLDKVKIFIDGILDVEVPSNIKTPNTNSTDICLGLYQGTSNRYNGFLDDVSLWNIELDELSIKKYTKGLKVDINNQNLIGYWNMDTIVNNQIIDSINKNNGLLTNVELNLQGCPISYYKYLIKQNNNYYSIKSEFYKDGKFTPITELDGKESLTKEDYDTYGFETLNTLTQNTTINSETFRPIDKLQKQFDNIEILRMEEK